MVSLRGRRKADGRVGGTSSPLAGLVAAVPGVRSGASVIREPVCWRTCFQRHRAPGHYPSYTAPRPRGVWCGSK
uniref:Putative secreted protein n=1 Tax=Anopheles darlingi TaxID=43151 RepID=A0A2M4D986_ANODA